MDYDDAYANVPYIPNGESYPNRWSHLAAEFRDNLTEEGRASLGVGYGPSERQAYDLFRPHGQAKGLCVFVHGGYWLRFDRSYWSHLAAGALAKGYAVAMPSYDLCPDVRVSEITRQVAQAVTDAAERIAGPIVLAGHSAGGQLVARCAVPGVLDDDVAQRLKNVLPISPVSDLRPLLRTAMNEHFRMDLSAAEDESPVLMSPLPVPVSVWVGAHERPVFLDQARWLSEAWDCKLTVAPDKHHFDVIEPLADPDSAMMADLIDD